VALGLAVAALRLVTPWPLELLELKALDLRFVLRGAHAPTNAVTIVGIDERSLARYGRWPWPRSRLTDLVERLTAQGARTIAFDAVFDMADAPNDAAFAAAIGASGRVVLGEFFAFDEPGIKTSPSHELAVRDRGGGVERLPQAKAFHGPLPAFGAAAADAGHVNFLPDGDGGFRGGPLASRAGGAGAGPVWRRNSASWLRGRTGLLDGGPGEARLSSEIASFPIDDSGEPASTLGPTDRADGERADGSSTA
jgi:adenylate cyclase